MRDTVWLEYDTYQYLSQVTIELDSESDILKSLPKIEKILDAMHKQILLHENVDLHRIKVANVLAIHVEKNANISLLGKMILIEKLINHPIFEHKNGLSYATSSFLSFFGMQHIHHSHPQMVLNKSRLHLAQLWKEEQDAVVKQLGNY